MRKGKFVVKLHQKRKHCPHGSGKMEILQSLEVEMERGNVLISL